VTPSSPPLSIPLSHLGSAIRLCADRVVCVDNMGSSVSSVPFVGPARSMTPAQALSLPRREGTSVLSVSVSPSGEVYRAFTRSTPGHSILVLDVHSVSAETHTLTCHGQSEVMHIRSTDTTSSPTLSHVSMTFAEGNAVLSVRIEGGVTLEVGKAKLKAVPEGADALVTVVDTHGAGFEPSIWPSLDIPTRYDICEPLPREPRYRVGAVGLVPSYTSARPSVSPDGRYIATACLPERGAEAKTCNIEGRDVDFETDWDVSYGVPEPLPPLSGGLIGMYEPVYPSEPHERVTLLTPYLDTEGERENLVWHGWLGDRLLGTLEGTTVNVYSGSNYIWHLSHSVDLAPLLGCEIGTTGGVTLCSDSDSILCAFTDGIDGSVSVSRLSYTQSIAAGPERVYHTANGHLLLSGPVIPAPPAYLEDLPLSLSPDEEGEGYSVGVVGNVSGDGCVVGSEGVFVDTPTVKGVMVLKGGSVPVHACVAGVRERQQGEEQMEVEVPFPIVCVACTDSLSIHRLRESEAEGEGVSSTPIASWSLSDCPTGVVHMHTEAETDTHHILVPFTDSCCVVSVTDRTASLTAVSLSRPLPPLPMCIAHLMPGVLKHIQNREPYWIVPSSPPTLVGLSISPKRERDGATLYVGGKTVLRAPVGSLSSVFSVPHRERGAAVVAAVLGNQLCLCTVRGAEAEGERVSVHISTWVEAGSRPIRIGTTASDPGVVLSVPRGNTETLYPRPYIASLLAGCDTATVLGVCMRHRLGLLMAVSVNEGVVASATPSQLLRLSESLSTPPEATRQLVDTTVALFNARMETDPSVQKCLLVFLTCLASLVHKAPTRMDMLLRHAQVASGMHSCTSVQTWAKAGKDTLSLGGYDVSRVAAVSMVLFGTAPQWEGEEAAVSTRLQAAMSLPGLVAAWLPASFPSADALAAAVAGSIGDPDVRHVAQGWFAETAEELTLEGAATPMKTARFLIASLLCRNMPHLCSAVGALCPAAVKAKGKKKGPNKLEQRKLKKQRQSTTALAAAETGPKRTSLVSAIVSFTNGQSDRATFASRAGSCPLLSPAMPPTTPALCASLMAEPAPVLEDVLTTHKDTVLGALTSRTAKHLSLVNRCERLVKGGDKVPANAKDRHQEKVLQTMADRDTVGAEVIGLYSALADICAVCVGLALWERERDAERETSWWAHAVAVVRAAVSVGSDTEE
ncbi:hypothetical protein KIPB_007027, partial [Kipferlia bialata]